MTVEAQRLAEECKSLLTAATNATFDCGEWSGESAAGNEEPERAYGPLAQAALDAKAAVHAAIDRLASLIPPGGLAEEARASVLEEAAKVCEDMHDEDRPSDYAYAIRALAGGTKEE